MIRDYIVRICLDSPLYLKLLEFQAKKKLGKTYAGLLVFVEGMRSLGLIDQEVYLFYKAKYDKPLETSPIKIEPLPKPKCFFCGNNALHIAVNVKSGKEYPVCQTHKVELQIHPKWKITE